MANIENLQPIHSKKKARELGAKGGKKSGEVKRARKTLKEELLLLLADGKVQETISLALINEAMRGNNSGSVTRAFEVIRDTIGEKPIDKLESNSNVNINNPYKNLSEEELKKLAGE